ncbi:hypothetical protein ACOBQX_09710 [Actinokineospora sp. G85]|uniref:hypothetical protein n=1 Tax=Actinokineospora sp. G85 TaxID=3406626 RepID=UPI003C7953BB
MSADETVRMAPITAPTRPDPVIPAQAQSPAPRKPLIRRIARRIVGDGILTKR